MKKSENFLQSLEQYVYRTIKRNPLPWPWMGIGVIAIAMLISLGNVKNSNISARNTREVIQNAAGRGDYETARELLDHYTIRPLNDLVLGVESELEDLTYPEKKVGRKIAELESQLERYPNHFEILLELSRLEALIGKDEQSLNYREMARVLDPNNAIFK